MSRAAQIRKHGPADAGPCFFKTFLPETGSIISLVSVLTGSLGLLAALDAGALIALTLTHLCHDAGLGAASLETLQGTVQALAFLDMYFGHLFSLPPMHPASSRALFKSH